MSLLKERPVAEPNEGSRTFEEYVRERSVALQRFAYLVTRHPEDARDAVQDALAGLYPRYDRIRAAGDVDAYVHRSIVNASVSRWRRTKRTTATAAPGDFARETGPRFDDAVVDATIAWALCGELPAVQRAAVVLRFYNDHSFAEIGRLLGCPESTARSHVHRALTRLRTRLQEADHE
ncbi:MAG: sigma-70 family RNA polymerase sigma factor [Propioniciclava sp.]|uniref:sigma-70 family RNA polymerase sigma factor n=1 Tax=Propioniciclava sp. TaxID=2038686 RepID=UPI0039E58FE5